MLNFLYFKRSVLQWGQYQKDEQIMFVVITLKITFEVLGKKNVCVCLITDTAFLKWSN